MTEQALHKKALEAAYESRFDYGKNESVLENCIKVYLSFFFNSPELLENLARKICREWNSSNVSEQHIDWCEENFWHKSVPEAKAVIAALKSEAGV